MSLNKQQYLPISFAEQPDNVCAYTTLSTGGYSVGNYAEYNLATHVGDDLARVKKNRAKLVEDLALPSEPVWLDQVHGNKVVSIDDEIPSNLTEQVILQADASMATSKEVVCAVLTADCLPVFFCNQAGTEVAVAHAGWRGLHAGVISNTLNAMRSPVESILVSLGPAIGVKAFEVGEEVRRSFLAKSDLNELAFVQTRQGHYHCDIYQLARQELHSAGVQQVTGGGYCAYTEQDRFYSFRRQAVTGRMASLIWLK